MDRDKITMTEIKLEELKSGHGDWWGVLHTDLVR